MYDVVLGPIDDFDSLGKRWRTLEKNADASFFQSWTFLGCLVEERFATASLLSVRQAGEDLALALIGSAGNVAFLNETGNGSHDAVFIEHNALLTRNGAACVTQRALHDALRRYPALSLSGVPTTMLDFATGVAWVRHRQKRIVPLALLSPGEDPLTTVSSNTKSQIKRSCRLYGTGVTLSRAETLDEALEFFAELVAAHQRAWHARGKPGAFGNPAILRFHEVLIRRAWPNAEIDVLRITAGRRHIGSLYNFVKNGRVSAYQSGFVYGPDNREKPGLLCHAMALRHYAERGIFVYDFLAGAERYKLSFSNATIDLHWAQLYRPWSPQGLLALFLRPNQFCFKLSKG